MDLKLPASEGIKLGLIWNIFHKAAEEKIGLQLHRQQRRWNALEDPEVKVLVEVRKLSMDEKNCKWRQKSSLDPFGN